MSAANPKAPFQVETYSVAGQVMVRDGSGDALAIFYGPDRQARAEALAAEYEQTYGPEWVVVAGHRLLRSRSGAAIHVACHTPEPGRGDSESGDAFRARICDLLNEHGGPQ